LTKFLKNSTKICAFASTLSFVTKSQILISLAFRSFGKFHFFGILPKNGQIELIFFSVN